jgi:hypothetical protein
VIEVDVASGATSAAGLRPRPRDLAAATAVRRVSRGRNGMIALEPTSVSGIHCGLRISACEKRKIR